MDNTIPQRFIQSANTFKNKTAFIFYKKDEWKRVTYTELLQKVSAISQLLKRGGIKKYDRIALCSENRPQWCATYLAISSLGAICIPLDAELGVDELQNLFYASDVKRVFSSTYTYEKVRKAFPNEEDRIIHFDSQEFCRAWQDSKFISMDDMDALSPDDIASIIYTSGTTGIPKGVVLTHKNFCSDADAVIETNLVVRADNLLSVLPLHHTYAFMCTFVVPLFVGATITYPSGLKGPDLINSMRESKVTILIGVPQLLEMILKGIEKRMIEKNYVLRLLLNILLKISSIERRHTRINAGRIIFRSLHRAFGSQLKFLASGGAKLRSEVMKRLEAYGFTVLEGYGLTETSPIVTFNPMEKRKPNSAGKPVRNAEIRIGDSLDSEGEILIKGPMVMKGYYNMSEETEKVLKDGWLYTGDIGYVDREGYLFITGRKKEVIVLGSGKNVYPEDVERQYSSIALVKEICIYGKEDGGVTLYGLIVPDTDYARKMKIVNIYESLKWDINEVSYKLPQHMRLKRFTLFAESLPRTPLGKLRRFLIQKIVEKKGVQIPSKAPSRKLQLKDTITSQVIESIKSVIGKDMDVRLDDHLELDIGFDSLKRIELLVELERRFGIHLPESFGMEIQSVNELIEKIKLFIEKPKEYFITPSKKGLKEILSKTPSEDELKNIGIELTFVEKVFRGIFVILIKTVFRLYFRSKIVGVKNIPDPPFILCPNHSSYLDGFLLSAMLPESTLSKIYFQGAKKYFVGPILSKFARFAHVIPIDPDTLLIKALTQSSFLLRKGMALCIFPEGGRTFDDTIQPFMKGIGILSIECNVPIIPSLIIGTREALPRGAILPRFKKVTIKIGKPVYPSDYIEIEESPEKDKYQSLADKIRNRVLKLYEME